jgi:hypothetical protein
MSLEQAIEFYAGVSAVVFEWLEPKFTLLTVIFVITTRHILGFTDNTVMAMLVWLHIVYLVLALISMYVVKVLVPRQKMITSIRCS